MSGFRRFVLAGAIVAAAAGVTQLRAQSVLSDPKDAPKVFASTCSACHKSPQGLAKSGQVAGFLRQHYTTGAEMSAAMAAYLVAAGSGPAGRKGAATVTPGEDGDAKAKAREAAKEAREKAKEAREARAKKQEQLAAAHPAGAGPGAAAAGAQKQKQMLRGKQRLIRPQEPETAVRPMPTEPAVTNPPADAIESPAQTPAEEARQTTATAPSAPAAAQQSAAPQSTPSQSPGGPATTAPPGQVELNIPPPPLPETAPPELSQSAFSSSPLP